MARFVHNLQEGRDSIPKIHLPPRGGLDPKNEGERNPREKKIDSIRVRTGVFTQAHQNPSRYIAVVAKPTHAYDLIRG